MDGVTELALLFKGRENNAGYAPMIGTIIELPELKIKINERITLTTEHVKKSCINLFEQDEYERYINSNKDVLLLPYGGNQKYIAVGVVRDVS